ncbi:hypothetical protein J8281_18605 [Aquimarina sp. U1-2]|uniref:hypothetical protein n=1 Tax=Aquimarina sp. U1-2 TaxID=2823141 RepID=UPI001AEC9DE7|nr:hypothetical protein [Aquimarina sp. U1-2]MBP2834215.1 hypothetical protein [Aquimarina sp. U1-2]
MQKIKKTYKITLFFILIFLIGIYSFTLYINYTIDHTTENEHESEVRTSNTQDREAIQVN